MEILNLTPGSRALYKSKEVVVVYHVDLDNVCVQECMDRHIHVVRIRELSPFNAVTASLPPIALNDHQWASASKRFQIIEPILNNKSKISEAALEHNISPSIIYVWIKKYKLHRTVASLANAKKNRKKGISQDLDLIISECIHKYYLKTNKISISRLQVYIKKECDKRKLIPPSTMTTRRRIKELSPEYVTRKRHGAKKARERFKPRFLGGYRADYPYHILQVDHTPLDIILVDEINREPFGKPNLTAALDIYSRMIVGFYLSFDPVGNIAVGICIANAILPKEKILDLYKIDGIWPCWGIPKICHSDNAGEFKSDMIKNAAYNYGITLDYRPEAFPEMGGHIESMMGVINTEVHNAPGTTFSNPIQKGIYDSLKNASLTITEFEEWILNFFLAYHEREHSELGCAPITAYREGIENITGPLPRIHDESLRYDFLPFKMRTIQEYGVKIDGLMYYDEILDKFMHATDNSGRARKFLFRIDPRDISTIYFFDPSPNINCYFEIPFRNLNLPPMSIWQYNRIRSDLRANKIPINTDTIQEKMCRMIEIEENAVRSTKRVRLAKTSRKADGRNQQKPKGTMETPSLNTFGIDNWKEIKPYHTDTDGSFKD